MQAGGGESGGPRTDDRDAPRVAAPGAPRRGAARWLIGVALFTVAFALRAWLGSYGLHSNRHWDERYAFENVASLIDTGSVRPVKAYYPSPVFNLPAALAVRAAQARHERTGDPFWLAYEEGRFRGMAYLSTRWLMALYGALGVVLLWRIGALVAGEGVGVLAAALLAFLPWHIHAGAIFKPDSLLVTAVLLTVWAALRAVGSGRLGWAALAGLGVALSASAKLTGVVVAAPLALGLLAAGPRQRSRWLQLATAGAASAASFVALNPYWTAYLHFVDGLKVDYAKRAAELGWSRLDAARESAALLFDGYVHGPLVGAVAVLGFAGLVVGAVRSSDRAARARWWVVLVLPLLYAGALVSQTSYFKPNNLLPVMPFTCLFAAWALGRARGGVGRGVAAPAARRALAVAAVGALLVLGVRPGLVYVHRLVTPSTMDLAEEFLRDHLPGGGRWVYVERQPRQRTRWYRARELGAARREVAALAAVPVRELDRADAEIFHARRLEGGDAAFYRSRMARLGSPAVLVVEPRWPAVRGAALAVLRHPRRPLARGALAATPCAAEPRCFTASLPGPGDAARGGLVSIQIGIDKLPFSALPAPPAVVVGGERVATLRTSADSEREAFTTPRLDRPAGPVAVEVRLPAGEYGSAPPRLGWTTWRAAHRPRRTGG